MMMTLERSRVLTSTTSGLSVLIASNTYDPAGSCTPGRATARSNVRYVVWLEMLNAAVDAAPQRPMNSALRAASFILFDIGISPSVVRAADASSFSIRLDAFCLLGAVGAIVMPRQVRTRFVEARLGAGVVFSGISASCRRAERLSGAI